MVQSPDGEDEAGKMMIEASQRAQRVPGGGGGEGFAEIGLMLMGNDLPVFGRSFFEGAEPVVPGAWVAGQRGIAFVQEALRSGGGLLFRAINRSVMRG